MLSYQRVTWCQLKCYTEWSFNQISSSHWWPTSAAAPGTSFFSEAPGSGIKGRPAPEVATDAPQARLVLTSNFMGFACFFAMDLSSKSLAQDRKYLKYDKIQQLTQVCLKLGLHLSDLSGTTSRPSLSRDDAPSVTGTPWYNPFLHIPFRFFKQGNKSLHPTSTSRTANMLKPILRMDFSSFCSL